MDRDVIGGYDFAFPIDTRLVPVRRVVPPPVAKGAKPPGARRRAATPTEVEVRAGIAAYNAKIPAEDLRIPPPPGPSLEPLNDRAHRYLERVGLPKPTPPTAAEWQFGRQNAPEIVP